MAILLLWLNLYFSGTFLDIYRPFWFKMVLSKTCTFLHTHCTSQNKYLQVWIQQNNSVHLFIFSYYFYPCCHFFIHTRYLNRKNFLRILNPIFTYAIMLVGKRELVHLKHKSNPHKLQLVGVLVLFFWMAKPNHQACYRLILTVKPFAYVVGDYTCHNRKNKREN